MKFRIWKRIMRNLKLNQRTFKMMIKMLINMTMTIRILLEKPHNLTKVITLQIGVVSNKWNSPNRGAGPNPLRKSLKKSISNGKLLIIMMMGKMMASKTLKINQSLIKAINLIKLKRHNPKKTQVIMKKANS